MKKIRSVDGLELAVEAHGSGPPVLFSCGYCTTRENFRPQVEPLVAAGYRVLLWDYRGHGESDAPDDPDAYRFDLVLDDMARVLAWGAQPPGEGSEQAVLPVLAGFSFGGLASLHFALRHPGQVRALVLIDTGPGFKNPEAQARWMSQTERTAQILEERGFEGFLRSRGADTAVGRDRERPASRAAAEAIARQSVHGVAWFGRRISGLAPGCIDRLSELDLPALVVVGEQDEAFRAAAEVMTRRLPRAEQVVIPGAGHVVTLEAPDACNAALLRFLGSLPA